MDKARVQRRGNLCRFGAAHAARSLVWSAVDLLLAWHLHARLGLSGVATGEVMFAFLVLGGTITFLAGRAISRSGASGATVMHIQLPATLATGLLFVLQFQVANVPSAIAVGCAFRIAYAFQDVTQNMLSSMLPADEAEAVRYARLRVMLSAVTRCCVVAGFGWLMPDGMATMLALIALASIVAGLSLRGLVFPHRVRVQAVTAPLDRRVPDGLLLLLLAWMIAAMVLPTLQRLLIFAPAGQGTPGGGAGLLGAFCVGGVIGPVLNRATGRRTVMALIMASGVAITVPPLAAPPLAIGADAWRVAGAAVHGIAVSLVGVRLWAATSQIAMADAWRGRTSDGLVFGSVVLTIHLASAAGMLVLGPLIDGVEAGQASTALIALALTVGGAALLALPGLSGRTAPAAA